MAFWPTPEQARMQTNAVSTTVTSTLVTGSGTAHTKGSWAELFAATSAAAEGVWMCSVGTVAGSATDTSMLLDIGLGASGSERVVVENLYRGHIAGGTQPVWLPVYIPAGERVAARLQGAVVSDTYTLTANLISPGGWHRPRGMRATTYGVDTATSNQVLIDDPTVSGTESAWTQIVASTTNPMRALLPLFGVPAGDSNITSANYLVDIAIGGSGSEIAIVSDLFVTTTVAEAIVAIAPATPFAVNLPAGIRLSARIAQSAASTAEPISVSIIGFD